MPSKSRCAVECLQANLARPRRLWSVRFQERKMKLVLFFHQFELINDWIKYFFFILCIELIVFFFFSYKKDQRKKNREKAQKSMIQERVVIKSHICYSF